MAILDDIRRFWDDDAATYDNAPGHHPTSRRGPGGVDRGARVPPAAAACSTSSTAGRGRGS